MLSLVYYGQRFLRRDSVTRANSQPARTLALLIAVGIGLHNFSEGLAIGSSSQRGALTLALALIIGFAVHNATEGFGIAAPMANHDATWGFLLVAGLIAGGPTFLGTLIGYRFSSEAISVLFLALAAGALIFVMSELFAAGRRLSAPTWNGWGLTTGLLAGFLTEFVLKGAGA